MSATIMIHLEGDPGAPTFHSHAPGKHYVWVPITGDAKVCVNSRADAEMLIKQFTDARDMFPPEPLHAGECTCGARVSAAGLVTPAGDL